MPRFRRNLTALTVLAFVAEQPRHPYEMLGLIRARHKDFVSGLPRSVYHAVDRLHDMGFIEPVETTREGNRPERTVYRVTGDGESELESWLAELTSTVTNDQQLFLAAMSFWPLLQPSLVIQQLTLRAARLEGDVAAANAQIRAIGSQLPRIVLIEEEYQQAMRAAELRWVQSMIADITSGDLRWINMDGEEV